MKDLTACITTQEYEQYYKNRKIIACEASGEIPEAFLSPVLVSSTSTEIL